MPAPAGKIPATQLPTKFLGDVRQAQGQVLHAIERLHGRQRKLGGDIEPGFLRRELIDLGLAKPIWDDRWAAASSTRRAARYVGEGIAFGSKGVPGDTVAIGRRLVADLCEAASRVSTTDRTMLSANEPHLRSLVGRLEDLERRLYIPVRP